MYHVCMYQCCIHIYVHMHTCTLMHVHRKGKRESERKRKREREREREREKKKTCFPWGPRTPTHAVGPGPPMSPCVLACTWLNQYVWHISESFAHSCCGSWATHESLLVGMYMTQSLYVTYLIHVWYDSIMRDKTHACVTWLRTHSCVAWLPEVWFDSFMCGMTYSCVAWPFMCDMIHSWVAELIHAWRD